MAGRLKLDELVTHRMPLERINEALDLMRAGKRFVKLSTNEGQSLSNTFYLKSFVMTCTAFYNVYD